MRKDKENRLIFESGDYPFIPKENILVIGVEIKKNCRIYLNLERKENDLWSESNTDYFDLKLYLGYAHKKKFLVDFDLLLSQSYLETPNFAVNCDLINEVGSFDIASGKSLALSRLVKLSIIREHHLVLFKLTLPAGNEFSKKIPFRQLQMCFTRKVILREVPNETATSTFDIDRDEAPVARAHLRIVADEKT